MRILLIGLIVAFVLGAANATNQQQELNKLAGEVKFAEEGVRQLRVALVAVEDYRNRLRAHEPEIVERLVREQLGYTAPGEVVVRLVGDPLTNR